MKIAVITRHAVTNYGSILQTIATQRVLEDMGHSCQIIDYIRDDEHYRNIEISSLKCKPEWNNRFWKRCLYLLLRQLPAIIAGKQFEAERKKYLKLTKRYTNPKALIEDRPVADIYLSGSDQLWGPVIDGSFDSTYCLSFTEDADARVAYAGSFGISQLSSEQQAYYMKWLKRYKCITVRENQAVDMLRQINITAQQVLDPTLLISRENWLEMAAPRKPKRYVLIYQIHNNPRLDAYAKKVAAEKKIPLLRISTVLHQMGRGGKFVWLPTASEFISYIAGAECLITDSFHGTAFAINLNVPFVEVLTENGTQSRNKSLLELTRLTDRILQDDDDVCLSDKPVDFAEANSILAEKRKESIEVLENMLRI